MPGDRAGHHAAGPGSVGQGPAESVARFLRRPGRGVLDRAAPARPSAARCRRWAATAASRSSKTWRSNCRRASSRASSRWATSSSSCGARAAPSGSTSTRTKSATMLYRDIYEKKLRMAMGQKFEEINAQARVDNYLAGTSHAPDKPPGNAPASRSAQDTAVRPTAGRAVGPVVATATSLNRSQRAAGSRRLSFRAARSSRRPANPARVYLVSEVAAVPARRLARAPPTAIRRTFLAHDQPRSTRRRRSKCRSPTA